MKQRDILHKILVLGLAVSYCSTLPLLSVLHSHKLVDLKQIPAFKERVALPASPADDILSCNICSRLQSTHGYLGFAISSPGTAPVPRQWVGGDIEPYGFRHPSPLQDRAPPIHCA